MKNKYPKVFVLLSEEHGVPYGISLVEVGRSKQIPPQDLPDPAETFRKHANMDWAELHDMAQKSAIKLTEYFASGGKMSKDEYTKALMWLIVYQTGVFWPAVGKMQETIDVKLNRKATR